MCSFINTTMKLLKRKRCQTHNCEQTAISVYGENPYCREHTIEMCELQNALNVFNEVRCNSSVPMVLFYGKRYCNSHFRKLIMKCNHQKCFVSRNSTELCFDKYWYCDQHKLKEKDLLLKLAVIFRHKLPFEIIQIICKYHFKNKLYV